MNKAIIDAGLAGVRRMNEIDEDGGVAPAVGRGGTRFVAHDAVLQMRVDIKHASPARQQAPEHDAADQRGEDAFIGRRRPLRAGRRPLPRVALHRVPVMHEVRLEQVHGFEVLSEVA